MFKAVRKVIIFNNYNKAKKTDKELAHEKTLEEREIWHKLVVKIITWKDGTVSRKTSEKVTPKEWRQYKKRLTGAGTPKTINRIEARLKETLEKIRKNGGLSN